MAEPDGTGGGGDGAWPEDPTDPRCPACDGPVSATASYCMHCEADLPGGDFGDLRTPTASPTPAPDATTVPGAATSDSSGATTAATTEPGGDATVERGWLHPESLFDDVSTVAVGIGGGFLVGVLWTLLAVFATQSVFGLLFGVLVWLGATAYVARTWSVFGAVRKASYLVAGSLVAFPLFWFTDSLQGGTFGGRVFAFVLSEVFLVPIALVVAGFGYWIGGKAPPAD